MCTTFDTSAAFKRSHLLKYRRLLGHIAYEIRIYPSAFQICFQIYCNYNSFTFIVTLRKQCV
jgi:hypothetical protein